MATGLALSIVIMQIAFPDGSGLASEKVNMESPRAYTFPQTLDMVIENHLLVTVMVNLNRNTCSIRLANTL